MAESRVEPREMSCFQDTLFDRWAPGEVVELHNPPTSALAWALQAVVWGAMFGLPFGAVLGRATALIAGTDSIRIWECFVLGAAPMATLGVAQLAGADTTRRLRVNWEAQSLTYSSLTGRRECALSEISALKLQPVFYERLHTRTSGSSEISTHHREKVYRAQIIGRCGSEDLVLLESDSREQHLEIAIEQLAPLAQELSESLHLELQVAEPIKERHEVVAAIARAPRWLHAAVLVELVVVAGWFAWRAQPGLAVKQARQTIVDAGGEFYERDDWRIGGVQYGPLPGIAFKRPPEIEEGYSTLREALRGVGRFEVDFSESGVDDADLRVLSGNEKLVAINLYRTRVSDSGVAALAECPSLFAVDLSRTRVTDEAIEDLARLPELKSLRLFGASITDGAIESLSEMKYLAELYLNDTRVTPEGLARLKAALPETEVHS